MLIQALKEPIFKRDAFSSSLVSNPFSTFFGISTSTVGSNVNERTALTLSAFYNGINIICNDYAKLPKGIFKKTSDGKGREALNSHPVKQIIDKKPNQYMVAYNFDTVMIKSAILKGNAYAIIERNNYTAQPMALQFVNQDETPVQVYKYNGKLWYKIKEVVYSSSDIIHVPGFSFNGITGIGVVKHAANSLGVTLASQTFAGEYYDGKGVGTGVLTTSKSMDDKAKTRYSEALSAMFARKAKWVVPVIDEASKFEHISVTPQEAQFLLSSEQGINEVARWLNISAQKLKNNKDVNNSISESLERQHVGDSIMPWAIKFQQEYDAKLLTDKELQDGIYTKFNLKSLLSADMVQQADYWSKLIYAGAITRNEVRAWLDINPLDGLDEPLTPVNTQLMEEIDLKLAQLKKELSNV